MNECPCVLNYEVLFQIGKDAAPRLHATTELVLKTFPEGTTNLGKSNPNASRADPTPMILGMMLSLFVMLTQVTYQTRTRQNPRMVMSLPLGISQYLGGPQYDLSCKIFESFQCFITEDLMRHLLEYLHTQGGVLQSYWNRNVIV